MASEKTGSVKVAKRLDASNVAEFKSKAISALDRQ